MKSSHPKVVATIESRMTSTRLPGKVLLEAVGKPILAHLIERVRRSQLIDEIVVATTANLADDPIVELADHLGVGLWRGSEDDVMGRVLGAAQTFEADVIVELTGDNPLIDPQLIDDAIRFYLANDVDYASNFLERSLPDGFPVEVFSTAALIDAEFRTDDQQDREHVTPFIFRNTDRYTIGHVPIPDDLKRPDISLTLDFPVDYEVISAVLEALYPKNSAFTIRDCLKYLDDNPDLAAKNRRTDRTTVWRYRSVVQE